MRARNLPDTKADGAEIRRADFTRANRLIVGRAGVAGSWKILHAMFLPRGGSVLVKRGTKAPARRYQIEDKMRDKQTRLDAERFLFDRVRQRRAMLGKLLEEVNEHWTYEDGVYRFYHHSFKVYYRLQPVTEKIVETLRELVPYNWELNDMFLEILKEGTGKEFVMDHNREWTKHTRPIVEAFLHAKFFLEMAVKYGEELKDEKNPPRMLPSGWAALLYLYNLR